MLGADVLVLKEGPCRERIWDSGNIPPSVLNLELGKLRALAVLKQRKDPSLSHWLGVLIYRREKSFVSAESSVNQPVARFLYGLFSSLLL